MTQSFITKISVNHVRHLNRVEIPLSENECKHLILTGKNGSGKTSVLESMRLYLRLLLLPSTDRKLAIAGWGDNPLKNQFPKKSAEDGEKVSFASDEEVNAIWAEPMSDEAIADFAGLKIDFADTEDVKRKAKSGEFVVAYYRAEREYRVKSAKGIEKVPLQDAYGLDESPGNEFVKYLKDLSWQELYYWRNNEPDKSEKIKAWFANFTKVLRRIYDTENLSLELNPEEISFKIKEQGKEPYAFDELSSGYAAILSIVIDLLMRMEKHSSQKYDLPGIVMIDEVDAHLHLSLQRNILPLLAALFPNIQFIVTTHSPYVLTSIPNAVVFDLENQEIVEDLSAYSVDEVAEAYFGAKAYSVQMQEALHRYKELIALESPSDEERAERAELRGKLKNVPGKLALPITREFEKIEAGRSDG